MPRRRTNSVPQAGIDSPDSQSPTRPVTSTFSTRAPRSRNASRPVTREVSSSYTPGSINRLHGACTSVPMIVRTPSLDRCPCRHDLPRAVTRCRSTAREICKRPTCGAYLHSRRSRRVSVCCMGSFRTCPAPKGAPVRASVMVTARGKRTVFSPVEAAWIMSVCRSAVTASP